MSITEGSFKFAAEPTYLKDMYHCKFVWNRGLFFSFLNAGQGINYSSQLMFSLILEVENICIW